jgi:hypothetical protein
MERHCVGALAPHLTARRLASNRRVLCASPACLQKRGQAELANHDCLVIKERDLPFGVWKLRSGSQEETVKVTGPLLPRFGRYPCSVAMTVRQRRHYAHQQRKQRRTAFQSYPVIQ